MFLQSVRNKYYLCQLIFAQQYIRLNSFLMKYFNGINFHVFFFICIISLFLILFSIHYLIINSFPYYSRPLEFFFQHKKFIFISQEVLKTRSRRSLVGNVLAYQMVACGLTPTSDIKNILKQKEYTIINGVNQQIFGRSGLVQIT